MRRRLGRRLFRLALRLMGFEPRAAVVFHSEWLAHVRDDAYHTAVGAMRAAGVSYLNRYGSSSAVDTILPAERRPIPGFSL